MSDEQSGTSARPEVGVMREDGTFWVYVNHRCVGALSAEKAYAELPDLADSLGISLVEAEEVSAVMAQFPRRESRFNYVRNLSSCL